MAGVSRIKDRDRTREYVCAIADEDGMESAVLAPGAFAGQ